MKYGLNLMVRSLFLAIFISSCTSKVTTSKQPNIIVFLVDDMGYGDPQTYMSSSKIPTPNIDLLASQGMRFTDAHSPSSVCTPTRYAILTGRYAWRSPLKKGVLGPYSKPLLEEGRLSIPKMLKEKGYTTALFGKWHLGMQWGTVNNAELPKFWEREYDSSVIDHSAPIKSGPLTAGFDTFFGVDVPNFPPYIFIHNDRMVGLPSVEKPDSIYGTKGKMLPGWKLEEILPTITNKAVSYINNHGAKNTKQPFFMQITTTSPHTPIVPAKEFIGKSQAGPYGDLVHQTDATLGEVMKALKNNGLEENTIVIFTSDNGSPARAGDPYLHGPEFAKPNAVTTMFKHFPNAPLSGMKADILEGGHRVPFIVKWPNYIPENKVSNETISSVDIMATLASVVNYQLPQNAGEDSYNLLPLLKGDNIGIDAGMDPIREATVHHSGNGLFAIRKGKWKMIPHKGTGGWTHAQSLKNAINDPKGQLYDLQTDPKETNNLWKQHPEVVNELKGLLQKYKEEGRSIAYK